MGENKHMKELDAFAKKYVKEVPPEQPSINFTANLMHKIAVETKTEVFKTKSLISKKGWFGIASVVIATLFLAFNHTGESNLNIPEFDFSFFDKIQVLNIFDKVSFSNTTVFAFIFFGLMIAIQFIYLKKYFDKRLC